MSTTACALALAATTHSAHAGPQGGVVAGGSASISRAGSITDISQSTQRAVIDWSGFDIDASETVNFLQPSTSSVTLNRVHSGGASDIQGAITAPGNVWIVNPKGVVIGDSARIDVGGFVATTADIDNDAFMAGQDRFDRPGDPNAMVVNRGRITFGEAGLVGLVGPRASNEGVIAGNLGRVVIAGTDAFAVDLAGDGILALPTGEATALAASNSGTISNAGGLVLIDAATAEGVLESTVSAGGVIEATTVSGSKGRIVLSGGGDVEITGRLDATGGADLLGGDVTVTGDRIRVSSGAEIDASGDAGGGDIRVGGDIKGEGDLRQASKTLVEDGATIRADAITRGDGGTAVIWSESATGFFGSLSLRGGEQGGDGGFAEISGGYLAIEGGVDLDAPQGLAGELLLDPEIINVSSSATIAQGAPGFDILFDDAAADGDGLTTTITPEFITSVNGTLTLQANSEVNIFDDVDNTATGNTLALTIEAGREIAILADLIIDGSITLDSAADFGTPPLTGYGNGIFVGYAAVSATGDLTMRSGAGQSISLDYFASVSAGGLLDFQMAPGTTLFMNYGSSVTSGAGLVLPQTEIGGYVSITAYGGDITQEAGTSIVEGYSEGSYSATLAANAGSYDILLPSTGNNFSEFRATGANIVLGHTNTGSYTPDLTIRGLFASGNVDIRTDGPLVFQDVNFTLFGDRDVDILGNATFVAEGAITTQADTSLRIVGDEATFIAAANLEDGDAFNNQYFDINIEGDLFDAANYNVFDSTLFLIGDSVAVAGTTESGGSLMIFDSFAQTSLSAIALERGIRVNGVTAGTLVADGFSNQFTIGTPGSVFLSGDSHDLLGINAGIIDITGPFIGEGFDIIPGDVTADRLLADTVTINDTVGDVTLTNGQIETLNFSSAANLSIIRVNFGTPDAFDFAPGAIGAGGTVTLNGVTGASLTGIVPNLALGFIDFGSVDISSEGSIVKIPDSALLDGQGSNSLFTTNAPPDIVISDAINSFSGGGAFGIEYTNLIRVTDTAFFNFGLNGFGGGDILLPHAETSAGAFHNDFQAGVGIGIAGDVAIEDANDIGVTVDDLAAGADVLIRADSDNTGGDGLLNFFLFGFNGMPAGTGTFLTTGDMSISGNFQTLQLVGNNAEVFRFEDLTIENSRLSGTLFAGLSGDTGSATPSIEIIDSAIDGSVGIFLAPFTGGTPGFAVTPLFVLPPGMNAELTRTVIGGDLVIDAADNIGLADVQIAGNAELRTTNAFLERVAIGGDLGFLVSDFGSALSGVSLTDTSVGGGVTADVSNSILADRLRVGAAATLGAGSLVDVANFVIDGPASLTAPGITLASGDFAGGLTLSGGTALTMTDVSVTGDLDTGLTSSLDMSRVLVIGALTVSSSGGLTIDNLSTTAGASFAGTNYDLAFIDIFGPASFADSAGITMTDAVFGSLDLGTQGFVSGQRLFVSGSLTGASGGNLLLSDLQVGGTTDLSASGALSLVRFAIGGYSLSSGGSLALSDGRAGNALTTSFTAGDATISNLVANSVDVLAFGDITLAGVLTGGLLSAASSGGDIFVGQVSAGTLSLDALSGDIVPLSGPGFADFTIQGAGELTLPGAIAGLADIEGPGGGASVVIGKDISTSLGDPADGRITALVDPVAGATGAPGLPALGVRPALPDVTFLAPVFASGCTLGTLPDCTEQEILVLIGPIIGDIMGNDLLEEEMQLVLPYLLLERPLFELPPIDFATLYSATGNENLWQRGARGAEEEVTQ